MPDHNPDAIRHLREENTQLRADVDLLRRRWAVLHVALERVASVSHTALTAQPEPPTS